MPVNKLILKESGEEILKRDDFSFPHTTAYVEPEIFPGGNIPWHWHEDVEVLYVLQGSLEVKTPLNSYSLSSGDSAFINTNVLHFQKPIGNIKVVTLNQIFNTSIIYGSVDSVFYSKYVLPILSCNGLDIMIFKQESVIDRKATELIRQSQDIAEEKRPGYEIGVRNSLSSLWLLLFEKSSQMLAEKQVTSYHADDRLKKMMEFIHNNYKNKITLKEIAYSANISEREAIRTFNNVLNSTPFAYLVEYRVRMATELLRDTKQSISQIAYDCGFSSASYFGKEFRSITGMSALEYRKKYALSPGQL